MCKKNHWMTVEEYLLENRKYLSKREHIKNIEYKNLDLNKSFWKFDFFISFFAKYYLQAEDGLV